jgi:hypothetical protein
MIDEIRFNYFKSYDFDDALDRAELMINDEDGTDKKIINMSTMNIDGEYIVTIMYRKTEVNDDNGLDENR